MRDPTERPRQASTPTPWTNDVRGKVLKQNPDGVPLRDADGYMIAIVLPDRNGFFDHANTIVAALNSQATQPSWPKDMARITLLIADLRTHAYDDSGHTEVPTHIANHAADEIKRLAFATQPSANEQSARTLAKRILLALFGTNEANLSDQVNEQNIAVIAGMIAGGGPLSANEAVRALREALENIKARDQRAIVNSVEGIIGYSDGPFAEIAKAALSATPAPASDEGIIEAATGLVALWRNQKIGNYIHDSL